MLLDIYTAWRGLPPDQAKALLDSLGPEEQRALLAAIEAEEAARRVNPIAFFEPHDKQAPVIASRRRIKIVRGGNRSGKTTLGGVTSWANALGYYPWMVPELREKARRGEACLPPRSQVPPEAWVYLADGTPMPVPNKGIIVSGLGLKQGIGSTIFPTLRDWWPRGLDYRCWFGPYGVPMRIALDNGSEFVLTSSDQDRMTFEGAIFHWAEIDEPIPAYCFNGIWRGLTDYYGNVLFTQTMIGATSRWLYNNFVVAQRADTDCFVMAIHDNAAHLKKEAIEEFVNNPTFTEQERQARVFGAAEFVSDVVWPQFSAIANVVPFEPIPRNWVRGLTVDPHNRRPWACAWWALRPSGGLVFYREHPLGDFHRMRTSNMTPRDYVQLFRATEVGERITYRFMDPNAGKSPSVTAGNAKRTLQQEVAEYGMEFSCRISDNLAHGIAAVADALRCDPKAPIVGDNVPRLQIMENCRNTIISLENFSYMPQEKETKFNELFSEEHKDFSDVVRYTIVAPKPVSDITDGGYLSAKELEQWADAE